MSKHGTIRRYALIIEKLRRKSYPSFEELSDFLFQNGFEVSTRTIQRDIEQIRFEFGIEINYDRSRNGYEIFEEESIRTESFLRFLEIANTAELLTESLRESKDTLNFISFESRGVLRGIEHLKPLLFAVKNYRRISFVHESFQSGTQRRYDIEPYLLKEYQNRWYVVGFVHDSVQVRIFGVDRISDLVVSEAIFVPDLERNLAELFENTIGLDYRDQKAEEVILALTPFQGKYLKALPLHPSQKILVDNESELRISVTIVPNYEFKQQILMHGPYIRVVQPSWLADSMKKSLADTLKNYE